MTEAEFNARLDALAGLIEERAGNSIYRRAWKIAAGIIRASKSELPIAAVNERRPRLDRRPGALW